MGNGKRYIRHIGFFIKKACTVYEAWELLGNGKRYIRDRGDRLVAKSVPGTKLNMTSEKRDNIISIMRYKQALPTKIVAWLVILIFSFQSATYGYERENVSHLRAVRDAESRANRIASALSPLRIIPAQSEAQKRLVQGAPIAILPDGTIIVRKDYAQDPARRNRAINFHISHLITARKPIPLVHKKLQQALELIDLSLGLAHAIRNSISTPKGGIGAASAILLPTNPEIASMLNRSMSCIEEAEYLLSSNKELRAAFEKDPLGKTDKIVTKGLNHIKASRNPINQAVRYFEAASTLIDALPKEDAPWEEKGEILEMLLSTARTGFDQTLGYFDIYFEDEGKDREVLFKSVIEIANIRTNEQTGVRAEMELEDSSLSFFGNPLKICLMIEELLTNAARAIHPKKEKIRLVIRKKGNNISINVSDTGKGILKKDLPHIFTEGWSTREGGGTGISFIKNTVLGYNGSITVFSKRKKNSYAYYIHVAANGTSKVKRCNRAATDSFFPATSFPDNQGTIFHITLPERETPPDTPPTSPTPGGGGEGYHNPPPTNTMLQTKDGEFFGGGLPAVAEEDDPNTITINEIEEVVNDVFDNVPDRLRKLHYEGIDNKTIRGHIIEVLSEMRLLKQKSFLVVGPGSLDLLPIILTRLGLHVTAIDIDEIEIVNLVSLFRDYDVENAIATATTYDELNGRSFDYVSAFAVTNFLSLVKEELEDKGVDIHDEHGKKLFQEYLRMRLEDFIRPIIRLINPDDGYLFINTLAETSLSPLQALFLRLSSELISTRELLESIIIGMEDERGQFISRELIGLHNFSCNIITLGESREGTAYKFNKPVKKPGDGPEGARSQEKAATGSDAPKVPESAPDGPGEGVPEPSVAAPKRMVPGFTGATREVLIEAVQFENRISNAYEAVDPRNRVLCGPRALVLKHILEAIGIRDVQIIGLSTVSHVVLKVNGNIYVDPDVRDNALYSLGRPNRISVLFPGDPDYKKYQDAEEADLRIALFFEGSLLKNKPALKLFSGVVSMHKREISDFVRSVILPEDGSEGARSQGGVSTGGDAPRAGKTPGGMGEGYSMDRTTYSATKLDGNTWQLKDGNTGSTLLIDEAKGFNVVGYNVTINGKEYNIIGKGGAPILFPFPNRIRLNNRRELVWQDSNRRKWRQELLNDKLKDAGIVTKNDNTSVRHGLVRKLPFTAKEPVIDERGLSITGVFRSSDHPLIPALYQGFVLEITHTLKDGKWTTSMRATNESDHEMPIGYCIHYYFNSNPAPHAPAKRENCVVTMPAGQMWPAEDGLPTGELVKAGGRFDFTKGRRIGEDKFYDDYFYRGDSIPGAPYTCTIDNPDAGIGITVQADPIFKNLILWVPEDNPGTICIEPQTAPPDMFRVQDGRHMAILHPKESIEMQTGVWANEIATLTAPGAPGEGAPEDAGRVVTSGTSSEGPESSRSLRAADPRDPKFYSHLWDNERLRGERVPGGRAFTYSCGPWAREAYNYLLAWAKEHPGEITYVAMLGPNNPYSSQGPIHRWIEFVYKDGVRYLADGTISQYEQYKDLIDGLVIPLHDLSVDLKRGIYANRHDDCEDCEFLEISEQRVCRITPEERAIQIHGSLLACVYNLIPPDPNRYHFLILDDDFSWLGLSRERIKPLLDTLEKIHLIKVQRSRSTYSTYTVIHTIPPESDRSEISIILSQYRNDADLPGITQALAKLKAQAVKKARDGSEGARSQGGVSTGSDAPEPAPSAPDGPGEGVPEGAGVALSGTYPVLEADVAEARRLWQEMNDEAAFAEKRSNYRDAHKHKTQFYRYRDTRHSEERRVFNHFLNLMAHRAKNGQDIRLLSAGCSTGEEAYTMAIELLERGAPADKIEVTGIDSSQRCIEIARLGIYGSSSVLEKTPEGIVARYFHQLPSGMYALKQEVKDLVRFQRVDLRDEEEMSKLGTFSGITYMRTSYLLEDKERRPALANLSRILRDDGVLMTAIYHVLELFTKDEKEEYGFRKYLYHEEEVQFTVELLRDIFHLQLPQGRIYDIAYDIGRLTPQQEDVIEEYIEVLRDMETSKGAINPNPYNSIRSAGRRGEPLISIVCRDERGEEIGRGEVDIAVARGLSTSDYFLKIVGMMNTAFAMANMPYKANDGSHSRLISYIYEQCRIISQANTELWEHSRVVPEDGAYMPQRLIVFRNLPLIVELEIDPYEYYTRLKQLLSAV